MVVTFSEALENDDREAIVSRLSNAGASGPVWFASCAGVFSLFIEDASDSAYEAAKREPAVRSIFSESEIPLSSSLLRHLAGKPRVLKDNPSVAFQGARGAYSEMAIHQYFGEGMVEPKPYPQFRDCFQAVTEGSVDFAVLPLENALTGSIHENFDLLRDFADLVLCGEIYVRIRHNLIAMPGTELSDIKRVFSHPQGLLQTAAYLSRHPEWEQMPFYDTAGSVAHIKDMGDKKNAAIAGAGAAQVYKMKILAEGIETNQHNYTRFGIFMKKGFEPVPFPLKVESLKASIMMSLPHKPRALLHCMQALGDQNLNLTKIESRPIHGKPWEYLFYIDVEIGGSLDGFHMAVMMLKGLTEDIRVLGVYPRTPE